MLPRFFSTSVLVATGAALGVAQALSFAPWNLPWLQTAALAALFFASERCASHRRAALLGWSFGLGWFGLGVSWVYISMHVYGHLPAPIAVLATMAFAAFLALYPALALWVTFRWFPHAAARMLLALPATWAGTEWLRGVLLTGFPWLASGYAHSDGPLAGFAPVFGVYGMTLIAAFLGGTIAACISAVVPGSGRGSWLGSDPVTPHAGALARSVTAHDADAELRTDALRARAPLRVRLTATLTAALVAAVALLAGGQLLRAVEWTQPSGAPIAVRLVQGAVPQNEKFADGGLQRAVDTFFPLLRRDGRADLVVLPESIFPLPLNYLPDEITDWLRTHSRERDAAVVFGVFIEQPRGHYYNSAVALRPDNNPPLQRYSKRHLVPFGEFVPWGFRWFVDLMSIPIGDQQRGAPYQGPMELAGQRIAVNICYEDLFGAEIIRAWDVPDRAPTLLLNISNLAWFDDSIALPQHLQISRLRALETGRPMLRATNTGATAIIDARGSVVAQLPFLEAAVLDADVRGYAGTTPYVALGNAPALGLIGALLAAGLLVGLRQQRRGMTNQALVRE